MKIIESISKEVIPDEITVQEEDLSYSTVGVRAKAVILIGESWKDGLTINTISTGGLWAMDGEDEDEIKAEYQNQLEILKFMLLELGFTEDEFNKRLKKAYEYRKDKD